MEPRGHSYLLHKLFDEIAHRYPERIAIDIPAGLAGSGRVTVTYAELNGRAGKLAAALAPVAQRDGIVAILLPRNTPELYVSHLAVMKSGAAFTCIDPKFPDEHLRAVLSDAGALGVITDGAGCLRLGGLGVLLPRVFDVNEAIALPELSPMRSAAAGDLAYVIYTSGTTGKPKGVMIEHGSIANLIQSDVEYFGLSCADRVAQCSSPAYDSSIEETWLAFSVGATLVPLDDATVRLGPDLIAFLRRERITVLCPPPTLLRSTGCVNPERELPDLRLLYVGGEALPADLADLWSAGRWLENGYGPTECTVTVTRARICAGAGITIGRVVKGNRAFIVGNDLEEVAAGEAGELCIAGPSLARGYHNRPDLTVEKFPEHSKFGRIYRTGDLVRQNAEGNLEYLGRIDSQVKLRGYRIELEAIEAILSAAPGVRAAACRVQGEGGGQTLVAHVIPEVPADPPGFDSLKELLRRALPEYMVPARFALIDALPTSSGGKLDRKALPEIAAHGRGEREIKPARSEREKEVAAAFAGALKIGGIVSIDDDFFLDLGGDSLGAVGVIVALRAQSGGSEITVRDLYEARTVERVARLSVSATVPAEVSPRGEEATLPRWPVLSTVVQSLWLVLELVAGSAVVYAIVFEVLPLLLRDVGLLGLALIAPVLSIVAILVYGVLSVLLVVILKRILIGRYRTMRVPVWGGFFTRHWIVTSAARLIPWGLVEGTPLVAVILRALGARVGRRVHVHRGVDLRRGGWDLLSIGDDVTLCQDVSVRLTELEGGQLILGPVTIESGATLDVRAGMSPGSKMEEGAFLSALSWLPSGVKIPAGELWDGVPAVHCGRAPDGDIAVGRALSPATYTLLILLGQFGRLFASALPGILAALVVPLVLSHANNRFLEWLSAPRASALALLIILVLVAAGVVMALVFEALMMRFLGEVRPGVYAQYSLAALRIWTKTSLLDSASRWLSGAMFWPGWLRLAGMRIARGSEVSTIIDTLPETVSIGAESFFADGIYFCGARRHRGMITVAPSSLGRGTFLGNHAVVPQGQEWPDGLFLGVSTPADPMRARTDTAWFGHPAIELPRREVIASDRRLTHDPNWARYLTRLFWEVLRFALPALPIVVGYEWYAQLAAAAPNFSRGMTAFVITPVVTFAAGALMCLAIVILKWVLLGRARPGQHAFWSCWCGRWDFLFMAWGFWGRGLLQGLEGTLLLNAFLRLTGVRIGRRVVLGPGFSQVVDPDMLIFEDDATVACHFQAHSFEDRILKLDEIRIGKGASAGENAVIFYGAHLSENARLAPHSVVMKRDQLNANTRYGGNPCRPG